VSEHQRINDAAAVLAADHCGGLKPKVGVVLGSGLGAVADKMDVAAATPYGELPGFSASSVEGHAGKLLVGELDGVPTAIMQGRVHLYEGHPVADVVRPVRTLVALGADRLIITNAAGAIDTSFGVGEVMLICDHLNLTGTNPLLGPNEDALGPRFPDMSDAYDAEFREMARAVAAGLDLTMREGVYAGLLGPSYETPAEIRMLAAMGASAVGMSTVLEVIAAHHMGARIVGMSCLSNAAAGLSENKLSHDEVKAAADAAQHEITALIAGLVQRLGA